jgi:hypothetical protein
MNFFDEPTERPEPVWQTILGCLFLAVLYGMVLLLV